MKASTIKKTSALKTRPARQIASSARSRKTAHILARADVGFGNTLFIRGAGYPLSWDHGIALENRGADEWVCELSNLTTPLEFKLLINDRIWCLNENFTLHPGQTLACRPFF